MADTILRISVWARFVAWMEAYGVDTLLTLNPRDFRAFESMRVLTPGTL